MTQVIFAGHRSAAVFYGSLRNSWPSRGVRHQQTGCPSSPPVKKEHHSLYVCAIVVVPLLSVTLSRMPLQLYDLPFDMLEMIGEFYDDVEQRDAASTLQAALKRHLVDS